MKYTVDSVKLFTVDVGDHVVLTNTQHVMFTGKKWTDKLYRHHTG